ncbi:MAG: hypothetical protein EP341_05660 [Sphingomonadales bacterium]|nr:MAG: hypothetical protein EP341_05660 [Sphingomonadales bacterium]
MSEVGHESFQVAIRPILGIPILMVRKSHPFGDGGSWCWGRWRIASFMDVVVINAELRKFWKK